MRRNALTLFASGLVLMLCGCGLSGRKQDAGVQSSADSVDLYASSVPMEQPDPYAEFATSSRPVEPAPPPETSLTASTGPHYHIVAKTDTLYGLARTYYGEARRWKDIYAANQSHIRDPNVIKVGQRLVIP